jgi:mevalonate kinase
LKTKYYSHGKLLLSGEYLVLRGAEALAIPCKKGQSMTFESLDSKDLEWESWDSKNQIWFFARFDTTSFSPIETNDSETAKRLSQILKTIRGQKKSFLVHRGGKVTTHLEFDRFWGLGSSSTLISNLALWSQTDAYQLLKNSFGGSGYDLACAQASGPLIYQKQKTGPRVENCIFDPPFKSHLFFVYLNQKKNSRAAIAQFDRHKTIAAQIAHVSQLTRAMTRTNELKEFEEILSEHERYLGDILGIEPVQKSRFVDFPGTLKSLGAWGGDFVLATGGDEQTQKYFQKRGYSTVLKYDEMVLG